MAQDIYTIRDDGISSIEYANLVEVFGKAKADELIKQKFDRDDKLDDDLEEIIADAPALIDD